MNNNTQRAPTLWTIGHSTWALDKFIAIVTAHRITALADVRRFPASRKYPHFNAQPLSVALASRGIVYYGVPELGGRRQPLPESPNTAWRNRSFRGYADYMMTNAFREAMERLLALARAQPTAIMCAEAVWWRCHRALIADYAKSIGSDVFHIIDARQTEVHPYTAAARIVDGKLGYS